jgi:hypothetical protein
MSKFSEVISTIGAAPITLSIIGGALAVIHRHVGAV